MNIRIKIQRSIDTAKADVDKMKCPAATQDLKLNTKNRDAAIKEKHIQYGPLNVDEPGNYWKDIADYWNTTENAAKKSLCGNCVAFDISPRMDDCMPGPVSDPDGRLGYCWMHHFKCHSARACRTWAKGGPIKTDDVSHKWQKKSKVEERCQKGYKTHPTRKTKKMYGKTYRNCVKADERKLTGAEYKKKTQIAKAIEKDDPGMSDDKKYAIATATAKRVAQEGRDPKKGTGKKPKGSGRRLYTDENPKDTVSVKFSSISDIRDTFSKESFKAKSHKRQSQIINLVHQRVRAAYKNAKDPETKARLKKAFEYATKRKEASKKKTERMNREKGQSK